MRAAIESARRQARELAAIGSHLDVDSLRELLRLADRVDDLEAYAYASYELYWATGDGSRRDRLRRAAAIDPERVGWSARARAAEAMLHGELTESARWNERAIELARARGDGVLEALAIEQLAIVRSLEGDIDPAIALLGEARERALACELHAWFVNAGSVLCDILSDAGRHDEALEVAAASSGHAREHDLARLRAFCFAYHAWVLCGHGDVTSARTLALEAFDCLEHRVGDAHDASAAALAAHVLLDAGDRDRAPRAVAAAEELAGSFGYRPFEHEARFAAARLAELRGDEEAAIEAVRALEPVEPVERAQVALWLARMGARRADRELVEAGLALVDRDMASIQFVRCAATELDGIAGLLHGTDAEAVVVAAGQWSDVGRPLEAARCRLAHALAVEDVEQLRAAHRSLQRLGARRDTEVAAVALRKLGEAATVRTIRADDVLTPRQRDVAVLVRDGHSTTDMARMLDVSAETVRYHLKGAFQAAGVASRVELAAWMRSDDPA